jgi:hypothetical protein
MQIKFTDFLLVLIVGFAAAKSSAQENGPLFKDKLPEISTPASCSLVLRYIDDSLEKAARHDSSLILILKSPNLEFSGLPLIRTQNLKNYIKFRGFKNFEVVVDLTKNKSDQIELHVKGELLYSIPITRYEKLIFTHC